jgi:hypothetical protein
MAREDYWTNGHLVITAATGMAFGEQLLTGGQCGGEFTTQNQGYKGSMIGYFVWDTTTLSRGRQGLGAADELFAASDGSLERVLPQVDHLMSGGSDYLVLTYTQAAVHTASNASLTPTMFAYTFKPVLQYGANTPMPTGWSRLHKYKIAGSASGAGSIPSDRWGDYAGAWHDSGVFWVSDMLFLGGSTPQPAILPRSHHRLLAAYW